MMPNWHFEVSAAERNPCRTREKPPLNSSKGLAEKRSRRLVLTGPVF